MNDAWKHFTWVYDCGHCICQALDDTRSAVMEYVERLFLSAVSLAFTSLIGLHLGLCYFLMIVLFSLVNQS
jgi:hypothetical protein